MQCQLTVTGLFVGLAAAGAILFDAQGAVWGTAIASVLGVGIWWSRLEKAQHKHFAEEVTV
jgi:uncharacterized membrane protein YjjB (DUF3815 family)